jgi:UDP-2,3-diacylglucosamine pyrophosphatase LpxH
MDSYSELKSHLIKNQGYLKWSPEKIHMKLSDDLSLIEVKQIVSEVKEAVNKPQPKRKARTVLQQRADELGIDIEDIKSYKIWDKSNGDIGVSVKVNNDAQDKRSTKDMIVEAMEDYKALSINPPNRDLEESAYGIINLYDAHLDCLCLKEQTFEKEDLTFKRNLENFISMFNRLVKEAYNNGVSSVIFPIGNDLWEANDDKEHTKRGTDVETNINWEYSWKKGLILMRKSIELLASIFEEVTVPVIYGNHSEDKEYYMALALEQVFLDIPHVDINTDKIYRKHYKRGKNMISLSHGYKTNSKSKIKQLPLNMATEASDIWNSTTNRIMYMGHIHHREQYIINRKLDEKGTEINFLRSVGGQTPYELINGFGGIQKTAYLEMFSEDGSQRRTLEITF